MGQNIMEGDGFFLYFAVAFLFDSSLGVDTHWKQGTAHLNLSLAFRNCLNPAFLRHTICRFFMVKHS